MSDYVYMPQGENPDEEEAIFDVLMSRAKALGIDTDETVYRLCVADFIAVLASEIEKGHYSLKDVTDEFLEDTPYYARKAPEWGLDWTIPYETVIGDNLPFQSNIDESDEPF